MYILTCVYTNTPILYTIHHTPTCGYTDAAVVSLTLHCKLHTLRLARCSAITDLGVEGLCGNLGTSLRHLNVSFCQRLTDRSLAAIGMYVYMCVCLYVICVCVYVYMCICVYVCMCVCVYVYMCACVY
jgi:hypothetical protein